MSFMGQFVFWKTLIVLSSCGSLTGQDAMSPNLMRLVDVAGVKSRVERALAERSVDLRIQSEVRSLLPAFIDLAARHPDDLRRIVSSWKDANPCDATDKMCGGGFGGGVVEPKPRPKPTPCDDPKAMCRGGFGGTVNPKSPKAKEVTCDVSKASCTGGPSYGGVFDNRAFAIIIRSGAIDEVIRTPAKTPSQ